MNEFFLSRFDIKCTFSKFVPTLSFPQVLSVFSLSRNQQTAPLPPSSTFLCLWVLVFNYFFDVLLGQRSKPGSHVFASSLTASNTKRANLTWLPLEIMHRGHTWHDYPWPWVSMTWLLYNLQLDDVPGADFENSLYTFSKSEKRYWVQCIVITHSCTGPRMASPQIASGVLQQLLCFLGLLWNPVIWKQTYNNSKLLVAAHLRGQRSNALCKVAFKHQLGFTGVGGSTVEPPPPPPPPDFSAMANGFQQTHSILASPPYNARPRVSRFQFLQKTIFCFPAQRLWETICNNFLAWWKHMGTHLLNVFNVYKTTVMTRYQTLSLSWKVSPQIRSKALGDKWPVTFPEKPAALNLNDRSGNNFFFSR